MNLRQLCLLFLVAAAARTTTAQGGQSATHTGGTTHIQTLDTLGNGADVIFVLDGSQRVSQQEWIELQNWLNQMIQYWHIGPRDIQVGFYTYGGGAYPQWQLMQAGNLHQAQTEISSLQHYGGAATAGQAIRLAYREGFSAANGGRDGVPKIIVHVTNGPADDPTFLEQEIQAAKQQGIYVYNIGVGEGGALSTSQQATMASEPSYHYVFRSENYQTLGALSSPLATNIAGELPASATGTGSLPDTSHTCLNQADVVFLLDGSGSVGPANFQTLTNYVKTFSSQLPVSATGVHVGVMQFSNMPRTEFGLPLYTDRASLLKGIDNIQYMGGGTNTDTALNAMRTQMFSQQMGARPGVPRIAVVVTDGRSSNMANTIREADLARQAGIGIIAVGVGSGVNDAELEGIADSTRDVFKVNDYSDLPGVTTRIMQAACSVQSTVAPISATVNPNVQDPCRDNIPNCNQYDANMCTAYAGWARDNCARHCKLCQPIVAEIKPPCQDKLPDCGDYDIAVCQDQQYRPWVQENCALYCGLCQADTATNGYYGQCYYKGNTYNTGETWNDGCDYTCTCVDGGTGKYSCNNKCPLYSNMPAECTLVRSPGSCCLEPVCNFNPHISTSITSGIGRTADGMSVCEYQGNQYVQGQSWDVGCSLKCVCANAATGQIKCQDYCPTYSGLPPNCHLQQTPGECCQKPVCEFSTQSGTITGDGRTSGQGAVSRPTQPAPCVDTLSNCAQYGTAACQDPYIEWATDNCRAYCGLCTDGRLVPTENDFCVYDGQHYRQGETWSISCDKECICEQAVYGYYRCYSTCPVYNNVPAECTRTPATGTDCCDTITCPTQTKIVPSTTNLLSMGSGSYILQPNPQQPNQLVPVVPSVSTGSVSGTAPPPSGYQAPTINGCLYKGQLYVQGQRWDDGCEQVCECTSASQGMYSCTARCPTYQNLPMGCTLQTDPADACCQVPVCQSGVNYVPVPVYPQGTVSTGVVAPPDPSNLMATSQTGTVTQRFPQSANSPPTLPPGPVPTGGIGYCVYKNQTYRQSQTWTDGCDYNCICEDASRGLWRCADMCLTYPPMPQYCRMITDPEFPCCQKPFCEIPFIINSTYGMGSTTPRPVSVVTTAPPMVITTTTPPRPKMCVYKGQEYGQGQEWYDGCDYRCTCYDAISNLYSCTERCPTFFGLDESRCTQQQDPRDPTCCTIPVCTPPTTQGPGTTPVPTVPVGSFEVTNTPGIGYCDYKGTHYTQGQRWDDGCQYTCECLDSYSGRYRCDEKCPRFPSLPAGCMLVTDFANPCCQKPTCNFQGFGNTISGQLNLQTPAPVTPAPGGRTPMCVYNNAEYQQGQRWDDGCDKRCRCEDAENNIYVCDDRCAKYNSVPPECVMVTDPNDQCCKIPQCSFNPNSGQITGQGPNPTPFPTASPGVIVGQPNTPAPLPGQTPAPIGYCVYMGRQYSQDQTWQDGCQYTCVCEDQMTGRYRCDERCPKYPNMPAECRLLKDPADPCCFKPDCTFNPNSGTISGMGTTTPAPAPGPTQAPQPGSTVSPPPGGTNPPQTYVPPSGTTAAPNPYNPPSPSPTPVCVYRNQVYTQGQTWYDGCDYECVCEDGVTGVYRCNDRCPSYPAPQPGITCTMKPDPKDPMCCQIPECDSPEPTPISPGGPYVVPTLAPQGMVTGGSVNPTTTPPPTPAPGQTLAPNPYTTVPPQPREVCVYKGQEYTQGQKWQDGCDYNCECVDAENGYYQCTEMCPRYPELQPGCYMVRDVYNPCCQTPVCPFPPTTTTPAPNPVTYQPPPTAPDGRTLSPPPSTPVTQQFCLYNGVPYKTGDIWDDGCELRCRCENMNLNIYRCDERCARYDLQPGCVWVTDPRDPCCRVPNCPLVVPSTQAPPTTQAPLPGQTPSPYTTPAPPVTQPIPVPTAVPGIVVGNSVNQPPNDTYCVYNGKQYRQSETWIDGCQKTCVCVDQTTGRYECKERCPVYPSVPSYCTMVTDPNDSCCEVPFCTPPATPAPSTLSPNPQTYMPNPGTTQAPLPGQTTTQAPPIMGTTPAPTPGPVYNPTPQPRSVCVMNGRTYVEGQQWYDGCDQICVCEDGQTGFYRCRDRCAKYPSLPAGCTLVVDPQDPTCCKVPQCAPTPGPSGYPTPAPGETPTPFTVTNVPGIVTGKAPEPTPGPDGSTPAPRNVCVYKGQEYVRGQRWQDGCDFNCVCVNEMTGEYKCEERCNTYPMIPPQCYLVQDPSDYCCKIMQCDMSRSTPNPYLTPVPQPAATFAPSLSPTTLPPTPAPGETTTPRPVPTYVFQPSPSTTPSPNPTQPPTYAPQPFCVYNGVAYREGDTWTDGCDKICRCDDADMNYYTCRDRCPVYTNINNYCVMTLDPKDACCQIPVCPDLPTPAPTPPGQTPAPGPTQAPTPTPYPLPQKVPTGTITGSNPAPEPSTSPNQQPRTKMCVYYGRSYRQGETWDDGCQYQCECIDEGTGRYVCHQRCDEYTSIPSYCMLVKDPADDCCMKPQCTPPPTVAPGIGSTVTPLPYAPVPQTYPTAPWTYPPYMTPVPGQTFAPDATPPPGVTFTPAPGQTYPPPPATYFPYMTPAPGQTYAPGETVPPGATYIPTPQPQTYPTMPWTYPPNETPAPGQTYAPYATPPPGVTFTPAPGQTYSPPPATYFPYMTPAPGRTYAPGETVPPGATYVPTPGPNYTPAPQPQTFPTAPWTYPPNETPAPGQTYAPYATPPHGVTFTPAPGQTYAPPPATYFPYMTPAPGQTYAPGETVPPGATYIPSPAPYSPPPQPQTFPTEPWTYPPYMTPAPGQTYAPDATPPPGVTFTPAPGQTYPPPPATYFPYMTPAPGQTYAPGETVPPGATYVPTPQPQTYPTLPWTYPPNETPAPGQTYAPYATPPHGVTFTPAPGQTYAPPPATYFPWMTPAPGRTYAPGETVPPGATFIPTYSPTIAPTYVLPVTTTPQPFCVMNGRSYTQGQQWYDGCRQICVCDDGMTGHYTCRQRCPTYPNPDPTCISVPDPKDPTCCTMPQCPNPLNPDLPTGQKGTFTGSGTPAPPTTPAPFPQTYPTPGWTYPPYMTPAPGQTYAPNATPPPGVTFTPAPGQTYAPPPATYFPYMTPAPGSTYPPGATPPPGATYVPTPAPTEAPQPKEVCVYKGQEYRTGVRWRDGCDYECVCEDGMTGSYKCTDRCPKYPPLTNPYCTMQRDPMDPCCEVPVCNEPTPQPGTLAPGQTPAPQPGLITQTTFCVYQGVPYRTGQTWYDGCDKVCRCEDGMTGTINCDDRCPKYQATLPGCVMVTDPQDQCCQIPRCEPPNPQEPTKVITGVPGTIEGSQVPSLNPNPLEPKTTACVYHGVQYQQGQTWEDGCQYTCICDDGMTGHYTCSERCARTPNVPPQCTMVQDPTDMCCQVPSCPIPSPDTTTTPAPNPYVNPSYVPNPNPTQAPQPGQTVAPQPGQTSAPNPYNTPAPTPPQTPMCVYKGQYYREMQIWYDGCNAVCTCEDASTNFYRCQERCGDYQNVDPSCIMVPDPKDPQCCKVPECPLIAPGQTTPATPGIIRPSQPPAVIMNYPTPQPQPQSTVAPPIGPNGVPIPQTTQAPEPRTGCMYKGRVYHAGERWDDGCDFECACLDDMTGQYRCTERCTRVPNIPPNCVLVPDPQDSCCEVPYCDYVNPTPFPNGIPTAQPNQTPVPGATTPLYYIPGYVTNNGGAQPTTSQPVAPNILTGRNQVCVYMGVIYRAGETWEDGCDKKCVCDDAVNGLYTCTDRCPSYGNPGPECVMRTNPADPCCLVPECNPNYVNPNTLPPISGTNPPFNPATQPGYTGAGTQEPYIIAPTAPPATFTGSRPPIDYTQPGNEGLRNMCVYQGTTYSQGQTWEDGCQFKCECVDAIRGTYRCSERCSNMYFMPDGCIMEPDPNDSCCQRARCVPSAFPTPTPMTIVNPPTLSPTQYPPTYTPSPQDTTPVINISPYTGPIFQATKSPIGSTVQTFTGKPPDMCVYTDGRTFRQGETWTDGCAYNCRCEDAARNIYECDFRCQVYSDLPTFCHLEPDPADPCCQKLACTPTPQGTPIIPVAGNKQPTASPTMEPSIVNVVPIGTHSVISGSGLAPGEQTPGFFGGRQQCVYKGTVYQPGDSWDDGCEYACQCLDQEPAVYSCVSKCPDYPPLPQYCRMVNVPGQCCQSMKCDVPNMGAYNPTPMLSPSLMPTPSPQLNPQIILSPQTNTVTGGTSPRGGAIIPPSTISGITDRCVYQGTDGQYRAYAQDETWTINQCDYQCACVDAHSGFYKCSPICPDYSQGQLPPECSLRYVANQCCPALSCTNPDGTVVNPLTNPGNTQVPVYGVLDRGYQGFKPGIVPGKPSGVTGYTNMCIYKGVPHNQGETWDDGCDYTCTCTDAHNGMYTCRSKCQKYTTLPAICTTHKDASGCCDVVSCQPPPTTAPPTTQPPATAPVQTGNCVDRPEINCQMYDKSTACTGMYEPWARDNCPVYCGLCPSAVTTPPGPCVDNRNDCAMYGQNACTGVYEAWARDNCAKYCNLCPCVDRIPNCDAYGSYACVGQYEAWARDNCMKTCGYCPGMQPFTTQMLPTGSGVVPDGWTLLLKGVSGVPGDLWQLWQSPNTANANQPAAQRLTDEYKGHYKPALANSLDQCDFDQMKVAIYNNGVEKASITFDGHNTGRDDWFTQGRIIDSTYSDLKQQMIQYFQLQGDPYSGREFYVGGPSSGCQGTGWFFVSTRSSCQYEAGSKPAFYYSSSSTASSWNGGQLEEGDVFAIMGKGGTCSLGATALPTVTHRTNVCVYKTQIYQQGEYWQDGCEYNCTCVDAEKGLYQCNNLCLTYTNLPSTCTMVKAPGECCAKPTGPGCDSSSGCLYNGQVYQQDQQWTDGCDYRCTCKDGATGRYECTSRCLQFQLPDVCHMDPAPAGKCCPVPNCPSYVHITYPPGYIPE